MRRPEIQIRVGLPWLDPAADILRIPSTPRTGRPAELRTKCRWLWLSYLVGAL